MPRSPLRSAHARPGALAAPVIYEWRRMRRRNIVGAASRVPADDDQLCTGFSLPPAWTIFLQRSAMLIKWLRNLMAPVKRPSSADEAAQRELRATVTHTIVLRL